MKELSIGSKFKFGRTEYTVVSIFTDEGKTFFVCKYLNSDKIYSYSNIFTFNSENILHKHAIS